MCRPKYDPVYDGVRCKFCKSVHRNGVKCNGAYLEMMKEKQREKELAPVRKAELAKAKHDEEVVALYESALSESYDESVAVSSNGSKQVGSPPSVQRKKRPSEVLESPTVQKAKSTEEAIEGIEELKVTADDEKALMEVENGSPVGSKSGSQGDGWFGGLQQCE